MKGKPAPHIKLNPAGATVRVTRNGALDPLPVQGRRVVLLAGERAGKRRLELRAALRRDDRDQGLPRLLREQGRLDFHLE